jgi:hypothetical protein
MATAFTPQACQKLHAFLKRHRLAVLSSTGPDGAAQSALINIAVTPELEIIFETTCETRKFDNIERDSRVSLVIGWDGPETMQYQGVAKRPDGQQRQRARDVFVGAFPRKENDEFWPGNTYFLVTPHWLRFSSYYRPRFVEEYQFVLPEMHPPGLCARLKGRLGVREAR